MDRVVHASCVSIAGVGVLVLGRSGSGKSDLLLRLLLTQFRSVDLSLLPNDETIATKQVPADATAPPAMSTPPTSTEIVDIKLVADDRVVLCPTRGGTRLIATPLPTSAGLLEVRGIGVARWPSTDTTEIGLVVELVENESDIPRLPDSQASTTVLDGVSLPLLRLVAHHASAPHKIVLRAMTLAANSSAD